MDERHESGILDTCAYIDLDLLDPAVLPTFPEITAITMAELHQGVAVAQDPAVRAARMEKLEAAVIDFEPLVFDRYAASRYGTLVTLVHQAGRSHEPRRIDLMIAAIASANRLPLYTRNGADFRGLGDTLALVEI